MRLLELYRVVVRQVWSFLSYQTNAGFRGSCGMVTLKSSNAIVSVFPGVRVVSVSSPLYSKMRTVLSNYIQEH